MARQSKSVKAAKGTLREDKTPDPLQGTGLPSKLYFSKSNSAQSHIIAELEKLGTTSSADSMAIQILADAWEDYQAARKIIKEQGYSCMVRMAKDGTPIEGPRPEVSIMDRSWNKIERLIRQLGFTPASRMKFPAPNEIEASLSDLLED